jgi:hypothetical protein
MIQFGFYTNFNDKQNFRKTGDTLFIYGLGLTHRFRNHYVKKTEINKHVFVNVLTRAWDLQPECTVTWRAKANLD